MNLTETEAGRKQCCGPSGCGVWVRQGDSPDLPDGGYVRYCIGNDCQGWRWQPLQADQPFMDAVKKRMDNAKEAHPKAVKYVRANLAEFGLPTEPFRGHCGLAGKIEA